MKTKIIIATHKPYWVPDDPVYLPVQMGHAIHPDIGYVGDDTGENISEKNWNFCELTGLYWAVHNIDAEYLGIVHYRRYFGSRRHRFAPKKNGSFRGRSWTRSCSIPTSSCPSSGIISLRPTTPSISMPTTSRTW